MSAVQANAILESLTPGHEARTARDLRPFLRRGLNHRLHMLMLKARAYPASFANAAHFFETVDWIDRQPAASRDRILDDVDVALWVIGFKLSLPAPSTPQDLGDFSRLVERCRQTDDNNAGTWPQVYIEDVHAQVLATVRSPSIASVDGAVKPSPPVRKENVRELILSALENISTIWPGMAGSIRNHIKGFAVIEGAPSSSSHRAAPGIVIVSRKTIDTASTDDFFICETLVHEAMHQMIFTMQDICSFDDGRADKKFTSPWSGLSKPLSVYVHIPVIYFFIAEYFARAHQGETHQKDRVTSRLRSIVAGMDRFFAESPLRAHLTPLGLALHDQVFSRYQERRACFLT
ncbi:MAG TPA: HEXXH motif-containing putative peptide modification protein [Azospirillaceae bacterium]|nr:HEXXH motif-containing putative peptide modification protein [Azospirillaceae bacterium]